MFKNMQNLIRLCKESIAKEKNDNFGDAVIVVVSYFIFFFPLCLFYILKNFGINVDCEVTLQS